MTSDNTNLYIHIRDGNPSNFWIGLLLKLLNPRIFHGMQILGILADFRIQIAEFRNIFKALFINKNHELNLTFFRIFEIAFPISSPYSVHFLILT